MGSNATRQHSGQRRPTAIDQTTKLHRGAIGDWSPLSTAAPTSFNFADAFSRSIGWVTDDELAELRTKRIAIAGLGGVGGVHLLTLTRLGVGRFNLSDFDAFELTNFNRQAGARLSTVGKAKLDVMCRQAMDINPTLDIRRFPAGVWASNVDEFLADVDLFIDGFDFFAIEPRREVFAACAKRGIPAITAAPLGMGAAVLNFMPGGMSFDEYFQLAGLEPLEQQLRFLAGLAPSLLHSRYLADTASVDFPGQRVPSTPMSCQICAGIAATNALKILLNRGPVPAAPRGMHFDAYRGRIKHTWRPWGNRNPLQKLIVHFARRQIRELSRLTQSTRPTVGETPAEQVMQIARWAPSGDNTQVWDFEVTSDSSFIVHGRDTRHDVVYDLQGRASQMSVGAMLETASIAATTLGREAIITHDSATPETAPRFDVQLVKADVEPDPLADAIMQRSTNRRPFRMTSISDQTIADVNAALPDGFTLRWFTSPADRWHFAMLMYRSAWIRLAARECNDVHRRVIERDARYSLDRIPDQAVGLDPLTTRLMHLLMPRWPLMRFVNRWLGGSIPPRVQLDLLPGLRCGAHIALVAARPPADLPDYIAAGRALQRVWLAATRQGLQFQPQLTPLIFADYARQGLAFSDEMPLRRAAARVDRRLSNLLPGYHTRTVFLARLGHGKPPTSRSLRLPIPHIRKPNGHKAVA